MFKSDNFQSKTKVTSNLRLKMLPWNSDQDEDVEDSECIVVRKVHVYFIKKAKVGTFTDAIDKEQTGQKVQSDQSIQHACFVNFPLTTHV